MKTLREILLERHRTSEPMLDEIRQRALAATAREAAAEQKPVLLRAGLALWRELILPNRRTWAGLAAAWIVILGLSLANRNDAPVMAVKPTPMNREMQQAMREQRQMLVQMLDPAPKEAVAPAPKPGSRGDVRQAVAMC